MTRAILAAALLLGACAAPQEPTQLSEPVRVGVLPDQTPAALRERYDPLVRHLTAATGLEMELEIPEDYPDLLDQFDSGRIQLAWFGGLTFLRAEARSGALPLTMRDVDLEFTTDFLVSASRTERSLADLGGASFAFGPRLSTSGHMMPRYHLSRAAIDPERFFGDISYSGGHDETARWVQEGRVDIGAVNSVVVEAMQRDGRLSLQPVRVLERTRPYRNYVWATRPDLPVGVRNLIRDAFMALDASDSAHAEILAGVGARGYVPANFRDYDDLRSAAELLGMMNEGNP